MCVRELTGLNNNNVWFPVSLIVKLSCKNGTELVNDANDAFTVFWAFID